MHIVLKNQPPSPFRGGGIGVGGIHPPPPMPHTTTRGLVLKGLKGQSHGQTEKLQRPENALRYQNIDKIITLR